MFWKIAGAIGIGGGIGFLLSLLARFTGGG